MIQRNLSTKKKQTHRENRLVAPKLGVRVQSLDSELRSCMLYRVQPPPPCHNMTKMNLFTNRNILTDIENKFMVTKMEREG